MRRIFENLRRGHVTWWYVAVPLAAGLYHIPGLSA